MTRTVQKGRLVAAPRRESRRIDPFRSATVDFRTVIAHLTGTILGKQPNAVVIDVNGVGYEVTIPVSTFYELGDVGEQASLRVHTHVREDAIQLFGFRTGREKELFLRLTSVSGIGPKLGITFLSGTSPDDLIAAIRTNDLARLVSIPGVGRKTAERVVIELRDKIGQLALADSDESIASSTKVDVDATRDDVVAALVSLGYQKALAEKIVAKVLETDSDRTIEHVLRQALKQLSK